MSEAALEPLRRSTRNTLLFTGVLNGLLPAGFVIGGHLDPIRTVLLVIGTAVFVILHLRRVLRAIRGPWQAFPLSQSYGMAALAIALTCLTATNDAPSGALGSLYTGAAASEFFIDRSRRLVWRHVAVVLAAHAVALGVVVILTGQTPVGARVVGFSTALALISTYGIGVSYRQWEGALRLEEARRDAADLAATRERLRLAEDLHDILGHALEVVSLKSELAARLADPDKSRAEMFEVQRLARDALRDVRALAHGNRPTDLATELAGARKLLDSAGITTDFHVDPTGLAEPERELLGRVLREAMTNALRHADPASCQVSLEVQPDLVVFTVVNDGVVPAITESGSGLKSLQRRVTAAGGEFRAQAVEPASFEVRASLPR